MKLTEEQIAGIVAAATEDIKIRAVDEATRLVSDYTRQAVHDTVYKEISAFVVEHVMPEVKSALLAEKALIVEAAVRSSHELAGAISNALLERVKTQMVKTSGYEGNDFFKKMLGIY